MWTKWVRWYRVTWLLPCLPSPRPCCNWTIVLFHYSYLNEALLCWELHEARWSAELWKLWLGVGLNVSAWWHCGLDQHHMWLEAVMVWPKNRLNCRLANWSPPWIWSCDYGSHLMHLTVFFVYKCVLEIWSPSEVTAWAFVLISGCECYHE